MHRKYFFLCLMLSFLCFCSPPIYENPCSPKSLVKLITLKSLIGDKSTVCGVGNAINQSSASISVNAFTSFWLSAPPMTGDILNKKIDITVPFGTNVSNLIANFIHSGNTVIVNGVSQISGVTPNNFSSPLTYLVSGIQGNAQSYIVNVKVLQNPGKAYYAKQATGSERYGNAETFSGSTSQGFTPTSTFMLASVVDVERDIFYASYAASSGENFIKVYDNASTNTNVVSRTITITPMIRIGGIALDTVNDRLYVVNFFTTGSSSINRFLFQINNASSRNGTLSGGIEYNQINSTALHPSLFGIRRMSLDTQRDILYVCDFGENKVFVYDNVSTYLHGSTWEPARIITSIPQPTGATLDMKNNILFISSFSQNSISVFDSGNTANGAIAPNRTILNAGMSGPFGIQFIYPLNRIYVANYTNNNIIYFQNARSINGNVGPTVISGAVASPTDISIDITK